MGQSRGTMAGYGRLTNDDLHQDLQIFHYRVCGFWSIINHYRETGNKSRFFKGWFGWVITGFVPLSAIIISSAVTTEKTMRAITLSLLMPMTVVQMAVNFAVIWNGLEIQAQLMDLMKRDYLKCVPPGKESNVRGIIDDTVKKSNIRVNVILVINCFTASVWNVMPILRSDYFRNTLGITMFGKAIGPNTLLGYTYPIDEKTYNETYWTQIIFVYEFFICGWSGFMITLLELLVVQLVSLLTGYLKALRYLVSEVKFDSNLEAPNEELLTYIKEHQNLIRVSDLLRKLYNFMVSTQLLTGLFIITLAPFNLILGTRNGEVDAVLKFVTFTMYSLLEVSVFCTIGTELQTTSYGISFAAYSNEWYLMDLRYRKRLYMMMMRSQNVLSLTAGRLYPVNFAVLNNILQTAYSTTALLYSQVTGGERSI